MIARSTTLAALSLALSPAISLAGIAYGLTDTGLVYRFDTASPGTRTFIAAGFGATPAFDGLTMDESGMLYTLDWNGQLTRIDPASGGRSLLGLVPRPGMNGFFKDLAWDPINRRMVASHNGGNANSLVVINPETPSVTTILGAITGLPAGTLMLGLAVSDTGQYSATAITGFVYDLNPATPGGPPLIATSRIARAFFSGDPRGLEYDHSSDLLYSATEGLRIIAASGSSSIVPGGAGVDYRDLAFPIPAPSCAIALLLAPLARCRRAAL